MKKLFYVAFCVSVAMMLGCATIVWPTITDNAGQGVFIQNTNGKAHLRETAQSSASVGGKRFEHVAFVDQAASAFQTVTDYDLELAAGTANFHSDTYCNPDWTGCAWFSNSYQPPASCTFYGPGSRLNLNCLQFSVIGLCFNTRSQGECGRALPTLKHLQASEITSLLNMGVEGRRDILRFNVNGGNTHITLQNPTGSITSAKLAGNTEIQYNLHRGVAKIDMSSPTYAVNVRKMAGLVDSGFKNGTATLQYGSVTRAFQYGLLDGKVYRDILLRRGQ